MKTDLIIPASVIGALLAPAGLSLLLLAAHFYRAGLIAGVLGSLALLAGLAVRRPWVPRLVKIVLVLGAAEWIRTLWAIADIRIALQQPVLRLSIILGCVVAATLLAALLFETPALRNFYGRSPTKRDIMP